MKFVSKLMLELWKNRGTWAWDRGMILGVFMRRRGMARLVDKFKYCTLTKSIMARWVLNMERCLGVWTLYKTSFFMFWGGLQERETWEIRWGNFRVEDLWWGFSWEVILDWETFESTLSEWNHWVSWSWEEIDKWVEIMFVHGDSVEANFL